MKFKNVKVGDKVLVPDTIKYKCRKEQEFLILKEVTRVTKTQFLIGNIRVKKDNGLIMGLAGWKYVCFIGDKKGWNNESVCRDETTERDEFKKKIMLLRKLHQVDDNILKISIDANVEKLEKAVEAKKILMRITLDLVSDKREKLK